MTPRERLFKVRPANRPLIFGHRGSPREVQENSITSFLTAFEEGADGVELDVRLTASGIPVVYHDDALPSGEVLSECRFDEVRRRAFEQGISLMTLAETLTMIAGKGFVDIEIKDGELPEYVIPIARNTLPPLTYVFSSFRPDVISKLSELEHRVPSILIVESVKNPEYLFRLMNGIGAAGFAPQHEHFTPEVVDFFRERKIPLFTFTVNDPIRAMELAQLGIVGIISDVPGELVEAFQAAHPE